MLFNILGLVLLLQLVIFANATFEGCDNTYNVDKTRNLIVNSPYYPNKYPSKSSCKYNFIAPLGYEISVQCVINTDKDPSACKYEFFYVSTDSDPDMNGAYLYCGNGSLTRVSEYNKLSLAYVSTGSTTGGYFSCTISVRLQVCDCGWSLQGRIVGGSLAAKTEYPSMVGLVNAGRVFCGGSIINRRTVVTAVHCVRLYSDLYIVTGDYDLSSSNDSKYTKIYEVARILEHPSYNPSNEANDIALLTTTTEMEWNRGVGPICLPSDAESTFDYYKADLVGWGTTMLGGSRSNILKKATVNIIPNADCVKQYNTLQSGQMCTFQSGQDACQFDSGGPVVMKRTSREFLAGIISFGRECGGRYAGVNVRITSYIYWIQQNSIGDYCYKPFS